VTDSDRAFLFSLLLFAVILGGTTYAMLTWGQHVAPSVQALLDAAKAAE
jgi:hypothetical protein